MKFTKIPESTFSQLQLNAGILLSEFVPSTATVNNNNIIGATTGGINFTATPTFSDRGDDIDNCPKNTMELKKLDEWAVQMTGTFVTTTTDTVKKLIGAADIDSQDTTKVVPRNDVIADDFADIWWVGDYSDKNGATKGGFVAIHMMNGLSTGGFAIQTSDKGKGNFAFTFEGHYSISEQDTVPFEVYVKSGVDE